MKTLEKTRFDTRIPKAQKDYFELAATLGGFRNLTEFIIFSARQQADKIIETHNTILASKKDRATFFNAITNPPKPSSSLKKAAANYQKTIEKR